MGTNKILELLNIIRFKFKQAKKRKYCKNAQLNIVPTMRSEINNENTAWIGTFQLVWNDFMDNEIKRPIEFEEGNNKTVTDLNKQDFKKDYIDESGYYIKCGTICPELQEEIKNSIKTKFNVTSSILSSINFTYNPLLKFFYAILKKDFHFLEKFDPLENDIFGDNEEDDVEYFGIDSNSTSELYQNVTVLFYSEDDYAVKLNTKSNDEILLYRTNKMKNFNEHFLDINNKTKEYNGSKDFNYSDSIKIPKFDFSAEASFEDLEDKIIKNTDGIKIFKTIETLKFKMDECGVELLSEAGLVMYYGSAPCFDEQRSFDFDKPFVMFLKEKDKQVPYFAMYVAEAKKLQ